MKNQYDGFGVYLTDSEDDPMDPLIPKMYDTFTEAMDYVYTHVYLPQNEAVTVYAVGCLAQVNDNESYILQDIICGMPDLTTFEVGNDATFLVDLPVPGGKKEDTTKGRKFTNKRESLLKIKAADDSPLIQYTAHIVSLDENGEQHKSTVNFDNFEDCRDHFTDNYDFDPKTYVSYQVSNAIKGVDQGIICSFNPEDRSMKFGDWKIKLQVIGWYK